MSLLRKISSGYELTLYGVVGYDFSAKQIRSELAKVGAEDELHVRIHSEGGYVMDGNVVRGLIKGHSGKTIAYIDGVCASQATIIALACDKILMAENANWMIHRPTGAVQGTVDDFTSMAKLTAKLENEMVADYTHRTGRTEEDVRKVMAAETWFTADEAKAYGFIDDIYAATLELTAQLTNDEPEEAYKKYKITAQVPPAPQRSTQPNSKMTDEQRQIVAQAMGLKDDASIAQITAKVNQVLATNADLESKNKALAAQVEALQKEKSDAEAKAIEARATDLIEQYKKAKVVTASSEAFWLKAAKDDFDTTKATLEEQAKTTGAANPKGSITGMMDKVDEEPKTSTEDYAPMSIKGYMKKK